MFCQFYSVHNGDLNLTLDTTSADYVTASASAVEKRRACPDKRYTLTYWSIFKPIFVTEAAEFKKIYVTVRTKRSYTSLDNDALQVGGIPYFSYTKFDLQVFCRDHYDLYVQTVYVGKGSE